MHSVNMFALNTRYLHSAIRIALIYAVVGGLWILFSDRALEILVSNPDTQASLQTVKGWFFVLVTAILLFGLVLRQLQTTAEAERILFETQGKFHSVFESLPLAVHGYDERGRTVFWNTDCEALYGFSRKEALGKTFMELFIPDHSQAEVEETFQGQSAQNEHMTNSTMTLVKKDGTTAVIHSSRVILNLPGGHRQTFFIDIALSNQDSEDSQNIPCA
ncbi:MAG: PAS domain-containing protein [Proteobacteria bacterium]|nr:PAS domain-containing protein [Pseudomonadota bacterium]MBU1611867.1 PAS domain-containing protein [Pseudomonadota bacterium]